MMSTDRWFAGLVYVALGAFAAYLGSWWSEAGSHFSALPMLFALGMGATGLAWVSGKARRLVRSTHAGFPEGRKALYGPAQDPEAERNEEAALLGHEMKNYLCTLKGSARLLRRRIQNNDQAIVDRIERVVEKLETFTENMSKPAQAVSTRISCRLQLAQEAKACISTHFHAEAGRFRWDIRDETSSLVGDPDRWEQVFLNLYANALEAGATLVTTTASRNGTRLELRIEDDGKGCAPEDLRRLFEPYFTTKQGHRRGLGMFIVQSIVENHGGRIHAQSKNGRGDGLHGLAFTLDFPITLPTDLADFRWKPAVAPLVKPFASEVVFKPSARWLLTLPEPF